MLTANAASAQMGAPADTIRYPYVAALSRTAGGTRVYFCAGTLIAPQWILTAAHCVHNRAGVRIPDDDLWAEAGADQLSKIPDAAQVPVERVVVHPAYDPATQDNDIALVHLQREVGPLVAGLAGPGREPVRGISLGFARMFEGMLAANATAPNGAPMAQILDRLRQASVAMIAPGECASRVPGRAAIDGARQICAGGPLYDGCIGDSGSPLVVEIADRSDRLAGIVSRGSSCSVQAPVTVYTRVSAYSGWIAGVLAARPRQPLHPRVRSR